MEKKLVFSLFLLGISSIFAQSLLIRELMISFYGNEFFVGIVLAFWLIWVAVGSLSAGKFLNKFKTQILLLFLSQILFSFFLFFELILIRYLKGQFFGLEIPNLIHSFFGASLIPFPICFLLGLWWTIATKIFSEIKREISSINFAYFLECLGFIFGGILFSFVLVKFNSFLVANFLIFLNLINAGVFIFLERKFFFLKILIFVLLFASFSLFFTPLLKNLEKVSAGFWFKNQKLAEAKNTLYGNIQVTKIDSQYNFFENGVYLGSEKDFEFAEKFSHLSLVLHSNPEKVLLIGGGMSGFLREILKHPVKEIYYLELDPKLIEISKEFISQELKSFLFNEKVKIINLDGLYFLKNTNEKFDLILVNLPSPSTALINRFYTKEFFQIAKERLKENGIFSIYLPYSPSAPNKNLENLCASVFKTLNEVFKKVIVLPEDEVFFFALNSESLSYSAEIFSKRFEERKIQTNFLTKDYINFRFKSERIEKALEIFEKNRTSRENQIFHPVSYFWQTLFWLDVFSSKFSNFFKNFAFFFLPFFASILLLLTIYLTKKKMTQMNSLFSVAIAGFSLMSFETILIFAYQVIVGYLYFRISLLISSFMLGMVLGVYFGNKKIKSGKIEISNLSISHFLLFCFSLILIPALIFLFKIPSLKIAEISLFLFSIFAGFFGGMVFPLANQIYLSFEKEISKKTGIIYSSDLVGSSFGALIFPLILIPVYGVFLSLVLISFLNFWLIFILLQRPER
jgi:spermidine synthase